VNITRRYEIDMGHCLPDHDGKCFQPHGHRYVVDLTVTGPVAQSGSEAGMVMDFARLKVALEVVVGHCDHRFAMSDRDPRLEGALDTFSDDGIIVTHGPPTAEYLAGMWGQIIAEYLHDSLTVVAVRVYETPNCWADWEP
jgi:6-pyruvoyltetrahydropterin/6-carboxytetrahydropterin synthase